MKITRSQLRRIIKEKFAMDDFRDVYATARMAHTGQKRRSGEDYFTHPSEVRNIVARFYPKDRISQLAALLHDTLEDAPGLGTVKSPEEMEEFIRGSISDPSAGEEVVRVVRALTHEKGGDYLSYVVDLMEDQPALRVKLADMVHNLSSSPSPKQKLKYRSALEAIANQTGGAPPTGISPKHWNQLFSLVESKARTTLNESKRMKITKNQLRKVIREAVQMMKPSDSVDTFGKVESLQPGDKITINGRPSIVVNIDDFSANLTYVADGKATLRDLDYRMAIRYDDDPADMLPEIEIIYMGKGQLPQRLRQPPRKKGPGRSYSVMD